MRARVVWCTALILLARAVQAAVPDGAALTARALPDGFAPGTAELLSAAPQWLPLPPFVPSRPFGQTRVTPRVRSRLPDTTSVQLAPLIDRHWRASESFNDREGITFLAGTLDLANDGYLSVITPCGHTMFVKIERGMSGRWTCRTRSYEVKLDVSIFRSRYSNVIQIRDSSTKLMVWERKINELFRATYAAGEPVVLAGRPYSMFYSHLPDPAFRPAVASSRLGFAFIFEESIDGGRDVEYKRYLVAADLVQEPAPVPFRLYAGDLVKFQASQDLSVLYISR